MFKLFSCHFILNYLVPVVFVNIFLAIAVDKLSEVQALKDDINKRTEEQEEIRKERQEKITALKRPQKIRQTFSKLLGLTQVNTDSPSPRRKEYPRRAKSLTDVPVPKKRGSDERVRASSLKETTTSSREILEVQQQVQASAKLNPLSSFAQSSFSDSFDEQGASASSRSRAYSIMATPPSAHHKASPLLRDERYLPSSISSQESSDEKSPVERSDSKVLEASTSRVSLAECGPQTSCPADQRERPNKLPVRNYERTQSLPTIDPRKISIASSRLESEGGLHMRVSKGSLIKQPAFEDTRCRGWG